MEISIDKIRKAFSKASIVFSNSGMSAVYTYKDRWFTQTLEIKSVFEELLAVCDGLSIVIAPEQYIRFSFLMPLQFDTMVFYPPLETEVALSLEDLLNMDGFSESSMEHAFEFFCGTDLTDQSAVFEKISEFMEMRNSEKQREPTSLSEVSRFREMQGIIQSMLNLGFLCDVETTNTDEDRSISLVLDSEESHIPSHINGDLQNSLTRLLKIAGYFGFEGSVNDGILRLMFTP